MEVYTPTKVLEKVKAITKDVQDIGLASRLGVSKQSLSQYKNKNNIDIQLRIITLLIREVEARKKSP